MISQKSSCNYPFADSEIFFHFQPNKHHISMCNVKTKPAISLLNKSLKINWFECFLENRVLTEIHEYFQPLALCKRGLSLTRDVLANQNLRLSKLIICIFFLVFTRYSFCCFLIQSNRLLQINIL